MHDVFAEDVERLGQSHGVLNPLKVQSRFPAGMTTKGYSEGQAWGREGWGASGLCQGEEDDARRVMGTAWIVGVSVAVKTWATCAVTSSVSAWMWTNRAAVRVDSSSSQDSGGVPTRVSVPAAPPVTGGGKRDGDLAKARVDGLHLFGEEEFALVQRKPIWVAKDSISARSCEEMRMVGRSASAVEARASEPASERGRTRAIRASMSSSRTRGSRPGKGLVEQDELGVESRGSTPGLPS